MLLHLVILFNLILVKKKGSNSARQQSIRYPTPTFNLYPLHLHLQKDALFLSFH